MYKVIKSSLDPIAKVILNAAKYMQEHTHAQERFTTPDGGVCMATCLACAHLDGKADDGRADDGSFIYSHLLSDEMKPIIHRVSQQLDMPETYATTYSDRSYEELNRICSWNNQKGITKEDVVKKLTEIAYLPQYQLELA